MSEFTLSTLLVTLLMVVFNSYPVPYNRSDNEARTSTEGNKECYFNAVYEMLIQNTEKPRKLIMAFDKTGKPVCRNDFFTTT